MVNKCLFSVAHYLGNMLTGSTPPRDLPSSSSGESVLSMLGISAEDLMVATGKLLNIVSLLVWYYLSLAYTSKRRIPVWVLPPSTIGQQTTIEFGIHIGGGST